MRAYPARIRSPTAISMTPTTRMKASPLTGSRRSAEGLRYVPQSARMLKNLSRPARNAPSPRPTLKAHQAEVSLSIIASPPAGREGQRSGQEALKGVKCQAKGCLSRIGEVRESTGRAGGIDTLKEYRFTLKRHRA